MDIATLLGLLLGFGVVIGPLIISGKIMSFVVIFIMISFVGGMALQQVLMRLGSGINKPIAFYRGGGEVSQLDMQQAQRDLTVLSRLMIPTFLQYKPSVTGQPDVRSQLLGQLLFPDAATSTMLRCW